MGESQISYNLFLFLMGLLGWFFRILNLKSGPPMILYGSVLEQAIMEIVELC